MITNNALSENYNLSAVMQPPYLENAIMNNASVGFSELTTKFNIKSTDLIDPLNLYPH